MRSKRKPVFPISVAADLCNTHPQTLRQYERLGLLKPERVNKNRLYSELDIERIKRIQRMTQEMGVNLAGVEIVMRLLDERDELQAEFERQFVEYVQEAERRMQHYLSNSNAPIRQGQSLLPVPNFGVRKRTEI